jgi:hypothetical protein
VRDVDRRHPDLALDARDLVAHLHPELRVQVRQRLVHEKQLWLADDRPAHRHALPLSAGQLARFLLEKFGETEHRSGLPDSAVDLPALQLP